MLRALFQFLNRDITGQSWDRKLPHAFFSSLVYFGNKDASRCYWEAEVPLSPCSTFIAYLKSPQDGPSQAEEAFCRSVSTHATAYAKQAASLIATVTGKPESEPTLESVEVPETGDLQAPWVATFAVGSEVYAVRFEHGEAKEVSVEDAG